MSGPVCASVRLSVSVFLQSFFLSKMDQIRKFGEQTSRILEFKPEGLEGKEVCNGGVACSLAADKPRPLLQNSLLEG